jgi:RimJ/RimL family protein N-acetyltransferase
VHQYIFGQDEAVAQFVAQMIPECRERGFGKCKAIGIANEQGQLLGGLVFRNWHPEFGTIEISGAAVPGTNWFSRRTIQVLHDYPFHQCGCQMVIMTTLADNYIVQRILAAIGYNFHYMARLGGRDCDGVVCTLTDDQWAASSYNAIARRKKFTEPVVEAAE